MAWFQKEIDYAKESLAAASDSAINKAGERLTEALKDVVAGASTEIDHKLDKISVELHNQRQFTKDDVKELVDYAAERLSYVLDDRIIVMKREISSLVEEKTEYLKTQVDDFFIQRQRDLALERRRLWMNIVLAFIASLAVGGVSLFYRGIGKGPVDMLTVFRIVLASLAGGYVVYLGSTMLNRWMALSEHRKDALYVAARYWGWLRPGSVFATLLVLLMLLLFSIFMLFPEQAVSLLHLHDWMSRFKLGP
ncbi:MAG: hypothetical protein P4L70_06510 [Parasulfuritortus sp.]|jgi:hypothetical protein|nr:hypothetical protein [Parasulfuritortus sp.]